MERGLYRCHECNSKFTAEADVQEHIMKEHGEDVQEHIMKEHGEEEQEENFMCSFCEKKFATEDETSEHVEAVHKKEENFMCSFCEKKFSTENETREHVVGVHRNVPDMNFMCSYCEEKFVTEEETSEHVERVHVRQEGDRSGRFAATAHLAALLPSQNRRRLHANEYDDDPDGEKDEDGLRRRVAPSDPMKILRQMSRPVQDPEDEDAERMALADELAELRNEPVPLQEKKRRRRQLLEKMEKLGVNAVVERGMKQISTWTRMMHDVNASISEFALWKSTLRRIEGRYGTAVYSFFKFIKWAMGLNLLMSVFMAAVFVPGWIFHRENATCAINSTGYVDTNTSVSWFPQEFSVDCCTEKYQDKMGENKRIFGPADEGGDYGADQFGTDLLKFLKDTFTGTGWYQYSPVFYGFYSPFYTIVSTTYSMPLAYFTVIFSCFLVSLVLIVRSSSNSFHSSFKWNEHNSTQYFVLVYCSWDFCLDNGESADIKRGVIGNEMKTALETDAQQDKDNSRTTGQRIALYLKRFVIRTLVISLFVGFAYLIVWLTNEQIPDLKRDQQCSGMSDELSTDSLSSPCFWLEYAVTIIITTMNMFLPFLFSYLMIIEEWSPSTAMTINLLQSMFVRLASLFVIMMTLYNSASCPTKNKSSSQFPPFLGTNSTTVQSCDSKYRIDDAGGDKLCAEVSWDFCWETFVGQQFWQLAILDFIIQLLMILLWDLPRSRLLTCVPALSNIQFDITKHVLDIVYSQTITWMALFFAPMIPLINFFKLFFIFFIRIFFVQYICKPTTNFFQASRASSIFKICLGFSVVVTIFILGFFICSVPPSISCGVFKDLWEDPFWPAKDHPNYFDVVTNLIIEWKEEGWQDFFMLFGKMTTLSIILIVLLLYIYLYGTRAVAFGAYNDRMEKELSSVASEKRILMATLQQRMAEKTFNKLFNKGESIRRN